jgi:tRNA modification GTPase
MNNKTIYALSTFYGQSSVAIVRVSGPECLLVAKKICNLKTIKPRYANFCKLIDKKGKVFDEGLAIYFKKPNSFTGEDVLEIQIHGGIVVIKKLIEELSKLKNLVPAKPGEFSERSFLNNKKNLMYFEGVNLIAAESENQLLIANRQAFGFKKNPTLKWKKKIQEIKAVINAEIEFSDDLEDKNTTSNLKKEIKKLRTEIQKVISLSNSIDKIKYGHKVVFLGPVNTGKSSLLNFLFQENKSITSKYKGTTTDQIEHSLNLLGEKVTFVDSAGIRESKRFVEKEGVKKTMSNINSDNNFILALSPEILSDNNLNSIDNLISRIVKRRFIIVLNKTDLSNSKLRFDNFKKRHPQIPNSKYFEMSCKKHYSNPEKLKSFKDFIYQKLLKTNINIHDDTYFSELRHYKCLENINIKLDLASNNIEEIEIASNFIDEALYELDNIFGRHDKEEELDIIFRKFCIGK